MTPFVLYVLGVPLVALAICVGCRRHGVLLLLGGLLNVPVGSLALWMYLWGGSGQDTDLNLLLLALPVGAAGLILLAGGLVRWGLARWRRAAEGDQQHP